MMMHLIEVNVNKVKAKKVDGFDANMKKTRLENLIIELGNLCEGKGDKIEGATDTHPKALLRLMNISLSCKDEFEDIQIKNLFAMIGNALDYESFVTGDGIKN